jgi:hypothetical protein
MAASSELKTVSEGRIFSMDIPANWIESPGQHTEDGGYLREYSAPEGADISISLYFRGRHLSDSTAAAVRGVLLKPSHSLLDAEKDAIDEVLGNAAVSEFCQLQNLRSIILNGRPVIVLEGLWQNGNRSIQIYISADGDAKIIQEVWFMSPDSEFHNHLPVFETALSGIKWIEC